MADFFDQQVDSGLRPEQFARIWVHTHPGACPQPSFTDEETFELVFGSTDLAVMFILARGGQTYCRLQFHIGPGGAIELPVEVDYCRPFDASDELGWQAEYQARVQPVLNLVTISKLTASEICIDPLPMAPRSSEVLSLPSGDFGFDDPFAFEEDWYD